MTTITSRKAALKEDINHVLEELWDAEEEEPFHKIFSRLYMNEKGTHKILRCSNAQLEEISCRDDDDAVHYLQKNEAGDFHVLVHYQSHLIATELFAEDAEKFRFNSITRKD